MTWAELADRYWNRTPGLIRGEPDGFGLRPDALFDAIVAAGEPFRRGMRFHTLPEVRFYSGRQRLPSPGDLLPDRSDQTIDGYIARLNRETGESFYLKVIEPLLADYRLWSDVRDQLSLLWGQVGFPVLPVSSELFLGADFTRTDDADAGRATVAIVLYGSVDIHHPEHGHTAATAGDLVYWPPGDDRHRFEFDKPSLMLRLRVPVDSRLAVRAMLDERSTLLQPNRDEPVPYLPPPPLESGALATKPHVRRAAALTAPLGHVFDAARADAALWAGRVSAAGLDPLPDPPLVADLRETDRIRVAAPVITYPLADDEYLWAVNGQVFSVGGTDALEVLGRLKAGSDHSVADLCRDDGEDNGALPLLNRLHQLGGVELVEEATP